MHIAFLRTHCTRTLVRQHLFSSTASLQSGILPPRQSGRRSSKYTPVRAVHSASQITRSNFQESLPIIQQALQDCQFYALDCEMSGLELQETKQEYLDDIEDRYHQTASGGTQFALTQFGLSAFIWSEAEHQYRPRTFNFYVFPKPAMGYDRRFLSQAGSLAFLAGQGFDFNKWIYEGVPFMPAEWRNRQLQTVNKVENRREISIERADDVLFVKSLLHAVADWMEGQDQMLLLESVNAYRRAIQYQQLEKLRNAAQATQVFYIQRINRGEGVQLQLVRATPQEAAQHEEEEHQARVQAIHDAAGFTAVFEMMRNSNKPAVGHNLSYDLTFSLSSFAQSLPPTWPAYKQLVQHWFPAGVWDTKHLAYQLQGLFTEGTSLGSVYQGLVEGGLRQPVADFLADQTSEPGNWPFPDIRHAEGYEAYQGPEASSHAHEAGYDAFMTGAAFACLVRLYEAVSSQTGSETSSRAQQQPNLQAVQHLMGRMNIGRSDIPYGALWGDDPQPDRSHVMLATCLHPDSRGKFIAEQLSKHMGVRVRATVVWQLTTPKVCSMLLEFPPGQDVDKARVAAALALIGQVKAQLLPWEAYSMAKKDGSLPAMLDSLHQSNPSGEPGQTKRRLDAVGNAVPPEGNARNVATQAIAGDSHRPTKKLKSMLPSCRMM